MIIKEKYSFKEHLDRFSTDQMCHDYLVKMRWNGVPECPKCRNKKMNYYVKSRNIYKCSNQDCKKQFSAIHGTIFQSSKVPLSKWFLAIYLFTTKKRGISSVQLSKWLGVKQHTAWYMLHRLREAMNQENDIILSGVVEADETFVKPKINRDKRLQAKKKAHLIEQKRIHGLTQDQRLKIGDKKIRGRKKGETNEILAQRRKNNGGETVYSSMSSHEPFEKGTIVLGMLERGGRVVLKKLGVNDKSKTRKNIYPLLKGHISAGSIFISDDLNLYNEVSEFFALHQTVNHKEGYVIDGIHINGIESVWKHLKKMLDGTYFHASHSHFEGYLHETTYRWNRRKESELTLFEDLIPMVTGKNISYKKLIERSKKLAA